MDRAFELAFEELGIDDAADVVRGHQALELARAIQDGQLRRVAERQVRDRILDGRAQLRRLVVDELARKVCGRRRSPSVAAGVELGLELLRRVDDGAAAADGRARGRGHARLHAVARVDGGAEAARVDAGGLARHLDEHRVEALAHLGVAVGERDRAVLLDGERGAADVGHAVADADVLDAAGEPDRLALGARGVVVRLDLVERRFAARPRAASGPSRTCCLRRARCAGASPRRRCRASRRACRRSSRRRSPTGWRRSRASRRTADCSCRRRRLRCRRWRRRRRRWRGRTRAR